MAAVGRRVDEPGATIRPREQVPRPQIAVDASGRLGRSGQIGPRRERVAEPLNGGPAGRIEPADLDQPAHERSQPALGPERGPVVDRAVVDRHCSDEPVAVMTERRGADRVQRRDGATGVRLDRRRPASGLDPGQRQPVLAVPEDPRHGRSRVGEPRQSVGLRGEEPGWWGGMRLEKGVAPVRQHDPKGAADVAARDRRPRSDGGAVDVSGERHRRDARGARDRPPRWHRTPRRSHRARRSTGRARRGRRRRGRADRRNGGAPPWPAPVVRRQPQQVGLVVGVHGEQQVEALEVGRPDLPPA